jgi:cytochrome bd-type quinol oxidase subunit 2
MDKDIRAVRILAAALIIGVLLLAGIALFLNKMEATPMASQLDPAMANAGIILAAAFISISFWVFKKRNESAAAANDNEKKEIYRAAVIVQFALLEAPALFNIIAFMLTGNKQSIIIAACCIIVMLTQFPSEEKFNRFGG